MLSIFFTRDYETNPLHTPSQFSYIRHTISETIDSLKNYYYSLERDVRRPNLLVNLIFHLPIDIHKPIEEIYELLLIDSERVCNKLGITTGIDKNSTPFIGNVVPNTTEYFMYRETDIIDWNKPYHQYKPIKLWYSNIEELFIFHPYIYNLGIENINRNIYTIDPVALGLSYYKWSIDRIANSDHTIDPARYVFDYLLTELIDDFIDITIWNMFKKMFIDPDFTPNKFININPIYIADFTNKLENSYREIIRVIKRKRLSLLDFLYRIPLIKHKNLISIFNTDYLNTTHNSKWLYWLGLVDNIIFLLENSENRQNRQFIEEIKRELDYDIRENVFSLYNPFTEIEVVTKIKKLKFILNKQTKR